MAEAAVAQVVSVSELTANIRRFLGSAFSRVVVEGEISGCKTVSSGHTYFTLKDEGAVLNAALFSHARASALGAGVELKDGVKVRVTGAIDVYPPSGRYSLTVHRIEAVGGLGELMRRLAELRAKLESEGIFEAARKPALPYLARRVGVVTSPTGAVIHDIVKVATRRFPHLQILLAPVKVQGAGAAESVANAIRWFNTHHGPESDDPFDVLIVGRGGGSLEDLWAFNEEVLVRAVAESRLPIISSVGHQTDVTLCDLAATRRAATPSEAAEFAVRVEDDIRRWLEQRELRMANRLRGRTETLAARLKAVARSSVFRDPHRALESLSHRVDALSMRLTAIRNGMVAALRGRISDDVTRATAVLHGKLELERTRGGERSRRLSRAVAAQLELSRGRLNRVAEKLQLLDPHAVLARGYSITRTADGKIISDATSVSSGCELKTQLSSGELRSRTF